MVVSDYVSAWLYHDPTHASTTACIAQPGHVRGSAIVFILGLAVFWAGLAGRVNFQLLRCWLGAGSAVLFEARVPRVRVEIFSDGVYAASATGLMIELLSGLLKAEAHGGGGGATDDERHSVWPGLVNYIYCFHVRTDQPRRLNERLGPCAILHAPVSLP